MPQQFLDLLRDTVARTGSGLPNPNINDHNELAENNRLLRQVLDAQAERIRALEAEAERGTAVPPHGMSVPLPPLMQDPRMFSTGYQHPAMTQTVVIEAPKRLSINEIFNRVLCVGGFLFVAVIIGSCVIR